MIFLFYLCFIQQDMTLKRLANTLVFAALAHYYSSVFYLVTLCEALTGFIITNARKI